MPPFEQIAWFPIAAGLTGLGVVAAVLTFRRRGVASGLRVLGWAILPMAIALTGLARLLYTVIAETVRWVGGLVISPGVWAGVALFFVSFVLLGGAGWLRKRRRGGAANEQSPPSSAATGGGTQAKAGQPEPKQKQPEPKQDKAVGKGKQEEPLEGMDEIDAILKRRGIE